MLHTGVLDKVLSTRYLRELSAGLKLITQGEVASFRFEPEAKSLKGSPALAVSKAFYRIQTTHDEDSPWRSPAWEHFGQSVQKLTFFILHLVLVAAPFSLPSARSAFPLALGRGMGHPGQPRCCCGFLYFNQSYVSSTTFPPKNHQYLRTIAQPRVAEMAPSVSEQQLPVKKFTTENLMPNKLEPSCFKSSLSHDCCTKYNYNKLVICNREISLKQFHAVKGRWEGEVRGWWWRG